jgi:hypothetical protein
MCSNHKRGAADRSSDRLTTLADAKNRTPKSERDASHTDHAPQSRNTSERGLAGKRKKRFVF